jgi:hypothetical protein
MYTRSFLFIACLCFLLTACGYGREEDKEAARQQDLQELNQAMEQSLSRIDSLKAEVSQRQASAAEEEKYSVMMARLEGAEAAYREWRNDLDVEPGGMSHDEKMQYYNQEEQRAESIRQEMQSAIQYVERELE